MKYLRVIFKNYIGFFNGMGLYTVDIDFTKCKHNIINIQGGNGRGKSTILNHLNPFPDNSSSFIPNKTAEKDLVLCHENDVYNIQIISQADLKSRKTTKAFIQKNGVELNSNGNISSYKDIIFSEFELDSNYISLSRLSSTDRGLGDKTPAERKRFTSNIIDNLEIYNNIYKALNKKSLIYKSHINTLHTKIQNIGDKTSLEQQLLNLKNREADISNEIMNYNNLIISIQAKNSIDEEEAIKIKSINDEYNRLNSIVLGLENSINSYYNKTKIHKEEIIDKYNSNINLLEIYNTKLDSLNTSYKDKNNRLAEVNSNILSIKADLSNFNSDNDIGDRYNKSNSIIKDLYSKLSSYNIKYDESLIPIIDKLVNLFDKLIIQIDRFNDNISSDDIEFMINTYSSDYNDSLLLEQKKLMLDIDNTNLSIADIQGQIKVISILDNRPKKCTIDDCPFISDAINLRNNLNSDLIDDLSNKQQELLDLSNKISEIQNKLDYMAKLYPKKMELDLIRANILENKDIILKFYPDFIDKFDTRLINLYRFDDIRNHTELNEIYNILSILKEELVNNKILKVEYDNYTDKVKLINSSNYLLNNLEKEAETILEDTKDIKISIDKYSDSIKQINSNINIQKEYCNIVSEYNTNLDKLNIIKAKLDEYNEKSSKALEALSNISAYKESISNLNNTIVPIRQNISTINGQLALLDTYYREYEEYRNSYNIIETLKKYCSPTGGGIQTIFMQIYMNRTKDVANEVLKMLFNGSYQLLDFIINEHEFRIPFIGEGLPVDDISSGSGAQVSMMSMIINLVLLHQASTKFNIAQLDELDANLDSYNRSNFINVLFYSMNVLHIEQLFIISHSIEADNTFADIINLGGLEEYTSISNTNNIIWDFNIDAKTDY